MATDRRRWLLHHLAIMLHNAEKTILDGIFQLVVILRFKVVETISLQFVHSGVIKLFKLL